MPQAVVVAKSLYISFYFGIFAFYLGILSLYPLLELNQPNWALFGLLVGLAGIGAKFGPQLPEMLGLETHEIKTYQNFEDFYPFYL